MVVGQGRQEGFERDYNTTKVCLGEGAIAGGQEVGRAWTPQGQVQGQGIESGTVGSGLSIVTSFPSSKDTGPEG